ncbi:hypothetical protein [Burkholderia ubonensis]|uniref:hypothetical protein n=1 Tax=Burkholderia ubonensis TaxID=101571 RepID=UPI001054D2CA|nr:hypothetical protein [Burkholderia ubonensis]
MREREFTVKHRAGTANRVTCPHCHSKVSYGASVCIGCKAEVKYGNPLGAAGLALIAALFAGFLVQRILPRSLGAASVLAFVAVFVWVFVVLRKKFVNDVRFSRRYRA